MRAMCNRNALELCSVCELDVKFASVESDVHDSAARTDSAAHRLVHEANQESGVLNRFGIV